MFWGYIYMHAHMPQGRSEHHTPQMTADH